ncbi:unnamed protein product [Gulo gulo]|uniref:Uncharacterized protein n=1 Tax=Gulo gulo TaxID=48420 RepID=A0A9X9LVE3_GULGU|nr:unnamed protein product [Gulo gulo]
MQLSDSEDLLCSAPAGPPDLEKDDGNHDPRAVDQWLERNSQYIDSRKHIPGKHIENASHPPHDVFVRKAKMLKKPRFRLGELLELHGEGSRSGKAPGDETSAAERADGYEPPVQESTQNSDI